MRHPSVLLRLGAPLAALLGVAVPARAQLIDRGPVGARALHTFVGADLRVAQPVGEFHGYVNAGFGFGFHVMQNLDPQGALSLRLDGGYLIYGHERIRTTVNYGALDRVPLYVTTTNNIFTMAVGPQLTVPYGPIRPYVNGSVGGAFFFTQSAVEGTSSTSSPFAEATNFSDGTFALTGGAGLYIPIQRRGRQPVYIDLGASYHSNGRTRYLRSGSIEDTPDGVVVSPIESNTNMVVYHLGVTVGVR